MKINIDQSIFRDYDIRGVYPNQLNEDTYYILGRSIATYLKVPQIAVGYDTRLSSLNLFQALCRGINCQGVEVVNLGLISTEIHYFASGKYSFPANIIISASHNPPEYNGLKIVTKGVVPLHGNFGLPQIKELTLKQNFPSSSVSGSVTPKEVTGDWIKHALTFIDIPKLKPLKAVVDAGNGMGGISWQKIIGLTPVSIIPLYFAPDGRFPNHLPDPLKQENMINCIQMVKSQKADVGIALDGDADRMFLVDDEGKIVSGTITTALLAGAILDKYGPQTILYNAVCGRIVPEVITSHSGKAVRVRVGHSFIKEYMKKNKAVFAGEHSGHFYFKDNYYAESSLIAGLLVLEYLSKDGRKLSKIVTHLNKYPQSGEINFSVKNPPELLDTVQKRFPMAKKIDHLDGLSVWFDNWWFNLRTSKTEPLVRLNLEADSQRILEDKLNLIENLLESSGGNKDKK